MGGDLLLQIRPAARPEVVKEFRPGRQTRRNNEPPKVGKQVLPISVIGNHIPP
jgi:hypothetical protein